MCDFFLFSTRTTHIRSIYIQYFWRKTCSTPTGHRDGTKRAASRCKCQIDRYYSSLLLTTLVHHRVINSGGHRGGGCGAGNVAWRFRSSWLVDVLVRDVAVSPWAIPGQYATTEKYTSSAKIYEFHERWSWCPALLTPLISICRLESAMAEAGCCYSWAHWSSLEPMAPYRQPEHTGTHR